MAREKYEYLGGRNVTVTCLGRISNDEAMDFLAEQIARIYHKKKERENK